METRKTSRLILRPWALTDAEAVYEQARNPKIGAMCGWPPHTSVAGSREIIEHVLCKPHSFAICLEDNKAIGSIAGRGFLGKGLCNRSGAIGCRLCF